MPETRVVNVRKEGYDIYIGRGSKWGNPFKIGIDGTRLQVIEKYKRVFNETNGEFMESLHELKGKRLGCHCANLPCHGDYLKKLVDKLED